ncbi:MAG: glycosyltransferase family 4 protein [Bryobacterales bacterium]|nr:glycosyltransferase family 4 protein [Bryobacterales bacterium]
MHFAVDAHAIGRKLTGNEVYVRNLLSNLALLDKVSTFTAFYSVPEAAHAIPDRFKACRVSSNPFVRLGFDLPRRVLQGRPDLLHVQYTAPLFCDARTVVSVHDVSFLERPEYFRKSRALQLSMTVGQTVRRAARVLTPSEYSRERVIHHYGLPEEKVVTIPMAVSPVFRPIQKEIAAARIARSYGLTQPFLLHVGELQPRKNHLGLIAAYASLIRSFPNFPHHLVMVGKDSWYSDQIRQAAKASGVADRLHFAGFVPDEDLVNFYNACDLFVFPSYYEGFGIPILEAMACGCAVACSHTSAMAEVANGTAILFNPESRGEVVRAIRDLLLDGDLRARLERMGLQRAAQFTWQNTASKTLDVYYDVVREQVRAPALVDGPKVL